MYFLIWYPNIYCRGNLDRLGIVFKGCRSTGEIILGEADQVEPGTSQVAFGHLLFCCCNVFPLGQSRTLDLREGAKESWFSYFFPSIARGSKKMLVLNSFLILQNVLL